MPAEQLEACTVATVRRDSWGPSIKGEGRTSSRPRRMGSPAFLWPLLGKAPKSLGKAKWRSAWIAEDSKLCIMCSRSIPSGMVRTSAYRVDWNSAWGDLSTSRGCSQVWAPCLDLPNQMTRGRFPHSFFLSSLSDTLWIYFCIGWGSVYKTIG